MGSSTCVCATLAGRARIVFEGINHAGDAAPAAVRRQTMTAKGSQKPKKASKKPAQRTLKEKRAEKRAATKHDTSLGI